ncbi:MAG: phosphoglucosamine mutase [Acidobacteriota bacterium]
MTAPKIQKLFGTDGIRGKAYEFPLDQKTVEVIGFSLTQNLSSQLGHHPSIIIGRDTRESGLPIQRALTKGAIAAGAMVSSAGVITTPGVAFITRTTPYDAGVVISASHNPFQDNGIKIFTPSGKKLTDEMESKIERDIFDNAYEGHSLLKLADELARENNKNSEADSLNRYLDFLTEEIGNGLNLSGLNIAIDCANGAASNIAPQVFKRLGANLAVIHASPNGVNINENCGALHLNDLQNLVRGGGFDLGLAFDGDADRALFVDDEGKLVDGDFTMLILAESFRTQGKLKNNLVVATVMSNLGLEIGLKERNIELIRAQVGDRFVLEEMLAKDASIGGEQSGHIILSDISLAGDGIITALSLLRAIVENGTSLKALAASMKTYPQTLVNIRVSHKPPLHSMPEVMTAIDELEKEMQGRGRVLIRYSGTENLARVMIEGENQDDIENKARRMAEFLKQAIG